VQVQQGSAGTPVLVNGQQYVVDSANGITIDPVAGSTAYRNCVTRDNVGPLSW
jgi:hypothetical protein